MGLGKEIKVVLSLDDAGYSTRVKGARAETTALNLDLGNLVKGVEGVEAGIAGLNADLLKMTSQMTGVTKSMATAVDGIQKTVSSLASMNNAVEQNTKSIREGANSAIDLKIKSLRNEVEGNEKIIASRQAMLSTLSRLENEYNARSLAQSIAAENIRRQKKSGSSREALTEQNVADGYSQSARVIRQEIESINGLTAAQRAAQQVRLATITQLELERTMQAAVAAGNASAVAAARAGAEEQRLLAEQAVAARLRADRQSEASAQQAGRVRVQAARTAAAEERAQAEMIGAMWKSMAQLYVASKIGQGLRQSITDADDYARVVEKLDAMGLNGKTGRADVLAVSKNVESANPNLSRADALKMTLASAAGAVNTDPKMLNQIVPEIVKMTTVMTRLFPEQTHSLEQFSQNMMGVMEARGITNDPQKMLETLDNLSRALILTQGKMTVQDYETISRRGGAGNASLKNNESILYDIAAASQLKVMGGSGGGAGGVSTFATMQRQAAKRVSGGTRETISGTNNLVEMGVIDKDELLAANGNKPLTRNYNAVKYKNSDEAANNMTEFAMNLVNSVKAKLAALPENDTRYFAKGADRSDDAELAKAFGAWADKSFGNTNVAEFYKQFATHGSQERIKAEVSASKEAPNYEQAHQEAMKQWGVQVDVTKAALEKLGVVVGDTLVPVLKPLLSTVTSLIDGVREFGENNPAAAQLLAIATATGGVILGFKAMTGLFGVVGNLSNGLAALSAATGTASTASAGMSSSTSRATATTIASLQATANSAAAHHDYAQMQLRAAEATVTNSNGMARLSAVTGSLLPAQQRAAQAAATHTAAQQALAAAQATTTLGARALNGVLAVTGGPIGLIITLLSLGAMAWSSFGSAASEAAKKAKQASESSADAVKATLKRIQDETTNMRGGANAAVIQQEQGEIAKLQSQLAAAQANAKKADDVAKYSGGGAAGAVTGARAVSADAAVTALKKEISDRQLTLDNLVKAEAVSNAARAAKELDDAKLAKDKNKKLMQEMREGVADDSTTDTSGLFRQPAEKAERDPLGKALGEAQGKIDAAQEKLRAIVAGGETVESLRAQAIALVQGKRLADDLSKDHDKKNRPGAGDSRVKELEDRTYKEMLLGEQVKAVQFANERVAATGIDADAAMQRLADNGAAKQTDAFRALSREMERAEVRIGAGTDKFKEWEAAKSAALFNQARSDAGNFAAGYVDKNKSEAADLEPNERARITKRLAAEREAEDAIYQMHVDTLERTRAADVEAAMQTNDGAAKVVKINADAKATLDEMDRVYSERKRIRAEQEVRATESATAQMTRQWMDVNKAVDEAAASGASSFVNMLTNSLTTGRLAVGDFIRGIVTDIANAKIKETLAAPLTQLANTGADWVKSNVFGQAAGGATSAAAQAATISKTTADTAAATATTLYSAATAEAILSTQLMSQAMLQAAAASSGSGAAGIGGMLAGIFGAKGGSGAGASSGAVSNELFANGGIMTSMGAMQLRKYANGGVANSPQVAIYGEGSMNEAYVPLPDGRTIPVTMSGGQGGAGVAPSVQVNVINQTGQAANADQGGMRFDGKQYILDVVMTAAATPGGFRSGMKDALK